MKIYTTQLANARYLGIDGAAWTTSIRMRDGETEADCLKRYISNQMTARAESLKRARRAGQALHLLTFGK